MYKVIIKQIHGMTVHFRRHESVGWEFEVFSKGPEVHWDISRSKRTIVRERTLGKSKASPWHVLFSGHKVTLKSARASATRFIEGLKDG